MSTLKVGTIQNTSAAYSSTPQQIEQGRAKAWVNFKGSDTVTINDSYNVTSIDDDGTGKWTVNLSITMANTNYVVTVAGKLGDGDTEGSVMPSMRRSAFTTTTYGLRGTKVNDPDFRDCALITSAVFGDV